MGRIYDPIGMVNTQMAWLWPNYHAYDNWVIVTISPTDYGFTTNNNIIMRLFYYGPESVTIVYLFAFQPRKF